MKRLWEVIKKILIWIGTVFVAIFTVLFVKEQRDKVVSTCSSRSRRDLTKFADANLPQYSEEKINGKAEKKREEAVERISRADARTICEGYGSVCDTIADGKERFRKRCGASRASATAGTDD